MQPLVSTDAFEPKPSPSTPKGNAPTPLRPSMGSKLKNHERILVTPAPSLFDPMKVSILKSHDFCWVLVIGVG